MPAMTTAYERGWQTLTQAHYSQSEWPSDELIAPLVNNGTFHLLNVLGPLFWTSRELGADGLASSHTDF
jgi:hypothetical protein